MTILEEVSGRVPSEPGSREPDPQAVPALSGFDPSRVFSSPEEILAAAYAEHGGHWSPPHPDQKNGSRDLGVMIALTAIRIAQEDASCVAGRDRDFAADMEARIKAARNVIAYGYSRRRVDGKPINPLKNGERCEHGRHEWEDCIGCYDEELLNALDGVKDASDSRLMPDRVETGTGSIGEADESGGARSAIAHTKAES